MRKPAQKNYERAVSIAALKTFFDVATLRSFHQVADRLNRSQPAVTMRIQQLEEFFGCALLERDRRHVAPTQKGQELLRYAERLVRLHAEMVEAVADLSAMRGLVRLGVSETIVHTWLPTLVNEVNGAYPNLELEIEVDISPNLRDRLVARDLDLALLLGPISNPNIQTRKLCSFPVAFVASNEVSMPRKAVSLEAIAKHPIITFSRNTQPYIAVRELFGRAGLQPTIHASASLATVIRLMLDGRGIAVIPPATLDSLAAFGKLRRLQTTAHLPRLNFVVGWPVSPDSHVAERVARIAIKVAADRAA
jgi:DNA-binding transcriptional LysR family regulator